jgi:hypothetical protein
LAVIPFRQIWINFGQITKTGDLAGSHGALRGARQHRCDGISAQPFAKSTRLTLAALG